MAMRDYEDRKDIVIPKEQEEMMNIICDAWDECRSLETCKECKDRPKKFMRMAMCNALKYTRKLIEAGYAKHPTADVQEVRHGTWEKCKECCCEYRCSVCEYELCRTTNYCPNCGAKMDGNENSDVDKRKVRKK